MIAIILSKKEIIYNNNKRINYDKYKKIYINIKIKKSTGCIGDRTRGLSNANRT